MKNAWQTGTAPKCTAEVPKPMILRKPPHTVHKVLKATTRPDSVSLHPYKHAAAIASSCTRGVHGDENDYDDVSAPQQEEKRSSSFMFAIAGVIGGVEYDPYHKYRFVSFYRTIS